MTISLESKVPTKRRRLPVRDAVAAGGVVLRESEGRLQVAVAGRSADDTWVFPKGTPDAGESIEQTALREVREETGLQVQVLASIGATEYWFASRGVRYHKVVHFFLMAATGGDVSQHDAEYDVVRWIDVADAEALLSFQNYRDVLRRAMDTYAALRAA